MHSNARCRSSFATGDFCSSAFAGGWIRFEAAYKDNDAFKMVCERPPRSLRSRLPLTRGRLTPATESFILPLRERESRRRRQGVAHTPSGIRVGQHALKARGDGIWRKILSPLRRCE